MEKVWRRTLNYENPSLCEVRPLTAKRASQLKSWILNLSMTSNAVGDRRGSQGLVLALGECKVRSARSASRRGVASRTYIVASPPQETESVRDPV